MTEASRHRDQLVRQLGRVFRERGYEGATLTALSRATGLGKASLYHHFPGGKAEMAEVLLRTAITDVQRLAFARLDGPEPPAARLERFVAGYQAYLEESGAPCLLGVLALGSARAVHGETLAAQFRDWRAALARVFEEAGAKPKRAARSAADVLDVLYGAQMVTALTGEPDHLQRAFKRLLRRFPR